MDQARRGFPARAFCFGAAFCGSAVAALRKPSAPLAMYTFGEHLTGKSKQASLGIAPGFGRQTRFAAGLLEELLARQAMFDGHLRKKQPALGVKTNEQPMMTDFD